LTFTTTPGASATGGVDAAEETTGAGGAAATFVTVAGRGAAAGAAGAASVPVAPQRRRPSCAASDVARGRPEMFGLLGVPVPLRRGGHRGEDGGGVAVLAFTLAGPVQRAVGRPFSEVARCLTGRGELGGELRSVELPSAVCDAVNTPKRGCRRGGPGLPNDCAC
jgi:hypothetical protein